MKPLQQRFQTAIMQRLLEIFGSEQTYRMGTLYLTVDKGMTSNNVYCRKKISTITGLSVTMVAKFLFKA